MVLQGRLLAAGAAGLAMTLAWWGALPATGDATPLASSGVRVPGSAVWTASPPPSDARNAATPALLQTPPWITRQAAGAALPVPITLALPHKLRVGEINELVVGLGTNAGVGEISFTVQFDANVLQVRAGTEGDWAAGANGRFAAEISAAEDRVQIRSSASGARRGGAGASIALVQFQAVAPGTTSVMVSDVTVKDLAGNPMPFSLASSNLQVTAESLPPAAPDALRPRGPVAIEALPPEASDTGD